MNESLTIWDTHSGERRLCMAHSAELNSLALSPDGTCLATGGKEGMVRIVNVVAGRERAVLFTESTNVSGLAFAPDGRRLYATGWGIGAVKEIEPDRDPRGRKIGVPCAGLAAMTFDGEDRRILAASWLRGKMIAVRLDGRCLEARANAPRVERSELAPQRLRLQPRRPVRRGAPAGKPERCRSLGGCAGWACRHPVRHGRAGDCARVSPGRPVAGNRSPCRQEAASGRNLVGPADGQKDGQCRIRATPTRGPRLEPRRQQARGRRGAIGAPSGATVWDARTWAVLGTLDRVGVFRYLAFHPDGNRLAVADYVASTVHLWDLAAGTVITNPGPTAVSCLAFTPDGKRLATLGYDGNVHLCDARTGDQLLVLRGFGPRPGSNGFTPRIAISRDGFRIVGNCVSGSLLNLWDITPFRADSSRR